MLILTVLLNGTVAWTLLGIDAAALKAFESIQRYTRDPLNTKIF